MRTGLFEHTIGFSMRLIAELRAEHDLIEAVAGSLRTFVAQRRRGEGDASDGARFVEFLGAYAGHFHHAREEDTLFTALVDRANLPQQGPIATLVEDHHRIASLLEGIAALLALDVLDEGAGRRLEALTADYSQALWRHIDAENSVLLPEAEARLRKAGVRELTSRAATADEARAKTAGEQLLLKYPPLHDPAALRGDGCVCCPAMGESCRGLEREWWNEWEWAEFDDHIASG